MFTESRQIALTDLELKVANLKGLFGKVQSLTLKKIRKSLVDIVVLLSHFLYFTGVV